MKEATKEKSAQVVASPSFAATEPAIDFKPQMGGLNKVHPSLPIYEVQEPDSISRVVSDEEWDDLLMSPESAEMLIEMADKAMKDFEAGRTTPLGAGKK